MSLILVVPPEVEPVTLAMAKAQVRASSDAEDTLIKGMIASARQEAENLTQTSIMEQTWELALDGSELSFYTFVQEMQCLYRTGYYSRSGAVLLRRGPVRSIVSVEYVDSDGVTQTLDPDLYTFAPGGNGNQARLTPAYNADWPDIRYEPDALRIRYIAGYEDAADVPQQIKQWILLRIGSYERFREDVQAGMGSIQTLPFADRLLDAFREY